MKAVFEKIESDEASSFLVQKIDQPSFDAPWHFHPECELTFIQEGSGDRLVGQTMESFRTGDLVLLGAELPHFWRTQQRKSRSNSRAIVVHFKEDIFGNELRSLPELSAIRTMLSQARLGLCFSGDADLCDRIKRKLERLVSISGLERMLLLLDILNTLVEARESQRRLCESSYLPLRNQKSAARMNRAYEYVYAHLNENISLDSVSQAAGMSPSAFSRYFKRMTGRNLSNFIGELRISQACSRLQETDQGIAEIAYEVGFGSLSNFNRIFKQLKGVSPRAFRRRV